MACRPPPLEFNKDELPNFGDNATWLQPSSMAHAARRPEVLNLYKHPALRFSAFGTVFFGSPRLRELGDVELWVGRRFAQVGDED